MELDLKELHIPWKGQIKGWKKIPRFILPQVGVNGKIISSTNKLIATIKPLGSLGEGTFGSVDKFERVAATGEIQEVAIKRPKHPNLDLFLEALFQWKLWHDLKEYGISFCVPRVLDIFRYQPTGDIWFSMEAFEPKLLSVWLVEKAPQNSYCLLPLLLLQIALVLEVFDKQLRINHRDLKINNMIIVEEPLDIDIKWGGRPRSIHFPFRIVFVDFGFACLEQQLDVREGSGLPPIDLCPKVGRDIFQVLVSLWSIGSLRRVWERVWGHWVSSKLDSAVKKDKRPELSYSRLTVSAHNLDWMHIATDDQEFEAPSCAPSVIIGECMDFLDNK